MLENPVFSLKLKAAEREWINEGTVAGGPQHDPEAGVLEFWSG